MSSEKVVAKFGGTSMVQPALVADIVKSQPNQKIIVCSAPGKSSSNPDKITDILFNFANEKSKNELDFSHIDKVVERFEEIVKDLDKNFVSGLLDNLRSDLSNSTENNFIVSRGEYYSALAFANRISAKFIDAKEIFSFDNEGIFDREKSAATIRQKLGGDERVVIPGFYGADIDGKIYLFGRGGSDRSGAIIAASLSLDYQNWTDVDGIMNADPAIIDEAKVIDELTYEEIREGAHGGTGVLMGDTILDLEYGKSESILKNTFNPDARGTRIKQTRNVGGINPVIAISARDDLLGLTIHDLGMRDTKGYLAQVMKLLARNQISIEHMPAAQDSITITFHNKKSLNPHELEKQAQEIMVSPSAHCSVNDCGVVYLVGEALRDIKSQQQVVVDSLNALEKAGVSILTIMMHPGSPSVAVILDRNQTIPAQKALFKEFLKR